MELKELLLTIGGIFHIALIVFHVFFWKLFKWRSQLHQLSYVNRQVMQIMNLVLMSVFAVFAYLSLIEMEALMTERLGSILLVSIGILWFARLIMQFGFFGVRNTMSNVFALLIFIGSTIYFSVAFLR